MELIAYFMQRGHFDPKDIGNDFSEDLYDTFLEMLDGQKRYFLKKILLNLIDTNMHWTTSLGLYKLIFSIWFIRVIWSVGMKLSHSI